MQVVGVFLMIISIWTIWAGTQSLNPLFLALAILQNSSSAQDIITQAKQQVQATAANPAAGLVGSAEALQLGIGAATGTLPSAPSSGALSGQANDAASKASYQAYAQQQLSSKYGLTDPGQMASLIKLWNQESGWNPQALNKSSGAFGIPQALPANKIPGANSAPAQTQIDWGLQYIIQRYGSPNNAWAHEVANNWY